MTTVELVRPIEFSEKTRLLQIYSGSYCTVIDGDYLYLIENTQVNPKNIIARIDVKENCEILDRDKVNVFIDWSNIHFGNKDSIEDLPEQQIKDYIIEFLPDDINELITFNQNDFSKIEYLINYFDEETKNKIYKAFDTLGITNDTLFTEAYSFSQINYLVEKQYYYICLNLSKLKYAVSSSNFKKYYTNGACGNWQKLIKNQDFKVIFFNKSDAYSFFNKDIENLLKKDLELETSMIINHLLKLEDKLTKSLNEMTTILTNKHGLVKIDNLYYPNVASIVDNLEVLLNKYHEITSKEDKLELFNLLKEKYTCIYLEFGKAQKTLKDLYNLNNKLNKETNND